MSRKRAASPLGEKEEEEEESSTFIKEALERCTECDATDGLCPMCDACPQHCLFGAEVCDACGGHKEGEEVPGERYCAECACCSCGALFTPTNEYLEDRGCTLCAKEGNLADEPDESDVDNK